MRVEVSCFFACKKYSRSFLKLRDSSPKNENSVITHPHLVLNPYDLRWSSEHNAFWEFSDPPIDSNVINMINVQKCCREIGRIIHVTSGFNCNFTELREYFLYAKKTKIMTYSTICLLHVLGEYPLKVTVCCSVSAVPRRYAWCMHLCSEDERRSYGLERHEGE